MTQRRTGNPLAGPPVPDAEHEVNAMETSTSIGGGAPRSLRRSLRLRLRPAFGFCLNGLGCALIVARGIQWMFG